MVSLRPGCPPGRENRHYYLCNYSTHPVPGKLGPHVFYTDASGERQFCRIRAIPTDPHSPAQSKLRALMSYASTLWSLRLTDPQREQWIAAALNAPAIPGWAAIPI